jgi:hypothetical protein
LVVALIHSPLDCSDFVMIGLPSHSLRLRQSVLKAVARLTYSLRRYDHVTDVLAILHWLRVPERIAGSNSVPLAVWPAPTAPQRASACDRPFQPSSPAVILFGLTGGTSPPIGHRQPPVVSNCCCVTLELSVLRRAVRAFFACLPLLAEDIPVLAFIYGP